MGVARGVLRLLLLLATSFAVIALHVLFRLFGRHWAFPKSVYAWLCLLFGIRVKVVGNPQPAAGLPRLYVANHLSYLDIIAMGAVLDGMFVAKSDVAGWPLFGLLAKIQNSIFIKRTKAALDDAKNTLAMHLGQGHNIIVFAEGTSTSGMHVKPFKPGLLGALYEGGARADVQPVAVVLEAVSGTPVGASEALRDYYAWWRPETTLLPHLWAFACLRHVDVTLHFLPALLPARYPDRKALAAEAHRAVSAKVEVTPQLG